MGESGFSCSGPAMDTGGRLVAGSHNRNEFVLINADESSRVNISLLLLLLFLVSLVSVVSDRFLGFRVSKLLGGTVGLDEVGFGGLRDESGDFVLHGNPSAIFADVYAPSCKSVDFCCIMWGLFLSEEFWYHNARSVVRVSFALER